MNQTGSQIQNRVLKHPLPTHKVQSGNKVVSVREDHAALSTAELNFKSILLELIM